MHLAALSIGSQTPGGRCNGVVHSVFREACNIRLDDGGMLTLLAPRQGNVPHGVRLEAPAGFDFAHQVAGGQRVGSRAGVLRIQGALSIDLATAQPWRGELPAAGADLRNPMVARAWRAAWHALHRARPGAGPDIGLLIRAVDCQGVRLARAARSVQADAAACAVDRLIGRGAGLTPAGDDLIVGLLAGLWSTTGDHPARRAFLDALCRAVAAAAAATGEISRVYLTHASRGHFAEALVTLTRRIAEGAHRGAVEAATAGALRVGHTSGGDGAFGLLLGLAAWAPRSVLPLLRAGNAIAGATLVEPGSPLLLAASGKPSRGISGPAPARHRTSPNAVHGGIS